MDEEQRDRISDLADMEDDSRVIWSDDEELEHFKHANLEWWLREALGHPRAHPGCCKTCGCATTCMAAAFFDATVLSTIRRLDELGLLRPPPSAFEQDHAEDIQGPESVEVERSQDETLNDPYQLWGKHPSYRCWIARHGQCEPEGADEGCTCSCGHQDPVCTCNSREIDGQGRRVHYIECPQADPPPARSRPVQSATVDPAVCPQCRGDNSEAFALCSKCSTGPDPDDWSSPEDAIYDLEVEDPFEAPQFTSEGCTCVPYKVVDGQPVRMTNEPIDQEDTRGPVTWCEHGADRHDAESGCIECRCIWRTGHEGPDTVRAL